MWHFWIKKFLWSKDISEFPEAKRAEVGFAKIYLFHTIFCWNQVFLIKKGQRNWTNGRVETPFLRLYNHEINKAQFYGHYRLF